MLKYGMERVLEPKNVIPVLAWRLDNRIEIDEHEIRISISKIQLENSNFRQIAAANSFDAEKIKKVIFDIVANRGKLHNPSTDTGGIVFGKVEQIGRSYANRFDLRIGDRVIYNTSLTAVPLRIYKIKSVNFLLSQIEVEGHAIAFESCQIIKCKKDTNIELSMMTLDESGSLLSLEKYIKGKKDFLVIGNSMLTSLLYGYSIKKFAGSDARVVGIMDEGADFRLKGKKLNQIFFEVFDEIYYLNILRPIECMEKIGGAQFDLCVNCSYLNGAETISVLAARPKGGVYFTNLVNNYNLALYITEMISKEIELKCPVGYVEGYAAFSMQLSEDLSEYFEDVSWDFAVDEQIVQEQMPEEEKQDREEYDFYKKRALSDGFIYGSRVMSKVLDEAINVAKYDCSVLVVGETGVGKEKIASIIHKNSLRKMQPFVKINCASVTDTLLESEFFGYEKGAFTGANSAGKKGYFELANKGTIFLDEIGELSIDLQAKLLRVIQDGEFYRVGGVRSISVDVRIIAATNRNLEKMVEKEEFRQDLYFRLNVFPIKIPPLRERLCEIAIFAERFTEIYNDKFRMNKKLTPEAIDYLKKHLWLGNIRELENVIQRLMINTPEDIIDLPAAVKELHKDIFHKIQMEEGGLDIGTQPFRLEEMVESYERQIIQYATDLYGSSRKVANMLGISQSQYMRKKNKYRI